MGPALRPAGGGASVMHTAETTPDTKVTAAMSQLAASGSTALTNLV